MHRRNFFISAFSILGISCLSLPRLTIASSPLKALETQPDFSKLIYSNRFSSNNDIKDFALGGKAIISFPDGRMRMQNKLPPELKQRANFVLWCPENFPANISVRWKFKPIKEPGLCILFFAAKGLNGESIFDDSLQKREGIYKTYHSGDINTYHISYFRRKHPKERAFHTCNLRKSKGFHMVAQGADPIASTADVVDSYKLRLDKLEGHISFFINELKVLEWMDNGKQFGSVLGSGKIGFRQMAPLVAEYSNLEVYTI